MKYVVFLKSGHWFVGEADPKLLFSKEKWGEGPEFDRLNIVDCIVKFDSIEAAVPYEGIVSDVSGASK